MEINLERKLKDNKNEITRLVDTVDSKLDRELTDIEVKFAGINDKLSKVEVFEVIQ